LVVCGELSRWEAWGEAGSGGDSWKEGWLFLVLPGSEERLAGHWSRSGLPVRSEEDKPILRWRSCNGGARGTFSQVGLLVTAGNIGSSISIGSKHHTSGQGLGWDHRVRG